MMTHCQIVILILPNLIKTGAYVKGIQLAVLGVTHYLCKALHNIITFVVTK